MIDQSFLHDKALAAILSGKLPARRPESTWAGPAAGAPCAVCDVPVAKSEIHGRGVLRLVATGLSDDEVREQVRARLATGRMPAVAGVSKSHRGTGRPCVVCRRAVEPTEVEREVTSYSGVVLTAHEACYKPWREESRVWRDLVAVGASAGRSGVTGRT